jgi:hypothetical protein
MLRQQNYQPALSSSFYPNQIPHFGSNSGDTNMGTSINVNFSNFFPQGETQINMRSSNPSYQRGPSSFGLSKPASGDSNKPFKSAFAQSPSP